LGFKLDYKIIIIQRNFATSIESHW